MNIQELARYYRSLAVLQTRTNGDEFWSFDIKDEKLKQLCFDAHGDMMPDDFIYEWIVDALDCIEDGSESVSDEFEDWKALNWLASHSDRRERLNEYVKDYGIDHKNFSISSVALAAMQQEKEDVFSSVYSSLEDLADDESNEDEDE